MDWIECNLPWEYIDQDDIYKSFMNEAIRIDEEISLDVEKALNIKIIDISKEKKDLVLYVLETCKLYIGDKDISIPGARGFLAPSDPRIARYNFLKEKEDLYYNAIFDHPKHQQTIDLRDEARAHQKTKSFVGNGLAKPGILIEVLDVGADTIQQFLIGDMNTSAGLCNDCCAFEHNAIVKRYKVIWQPNGNSNS